MSIMDNLPHTPTAIYGIDFSGAVDAGRKIWISLAKTRGEVLEIRHCFQGLNLPDSGRQLQACLGALARFIAFHRNSIFGLDFPFSVPRAILEKLGCENWRQFILAFPHKFGDPHDFKSKCKELTGNRESRRITDRESHTPFSPYNLRMFKQTYFGTKDLLYPLLQQNRACVIPMQAIMDDRPVILEICPRSTLIAEKIAGQKYKGKTKQHRENRRQILKQLADRNVAIPDKQLGRLILNDAAGDALDSVIAAYAVSKALNNPTFPFPPGWKKEYGLEGYVYT
jgi:hypothetical protein